MEVGVGAVLPLGRIVVEMFVAHMAEDRSEKQLRQEAGREEIGLICRSSARTALPTVVDWDIETEALSSPSD